MPAAHGMSAEIAFPVRGYSRLGVIDIVDTDDFVDRPALERFGDVHPNNPFRNIRVWNFRKRVAPKDFGQSHTPFFAAQTVDVLHFAQIRIEWLDRISIADDFSVLIAAK